MSKNTLIVIETIKAIDNAASIAPKPVTIPLLLSSSVMLLGEVEIVGLEVGAAETKSYTALMIICN